MEMCLAFFDLISILEQQDSNPVLLGEAFAAITCLTDISMSLSPYTPGVLVIYLCFLQNNYERRLVVSTSILKC